MSLVRRVSNTETIFMKASPTRGTARAVPLTAPMGKTAMSKSSNEAQEATKSADDIKSALDEASAILDGQREKRQTKLRRADAKRRKRRHHDKAIERVASGRRSILYDSRPANANERRQREKEQSALAGRKDRSWDSLSSVEQNRRIEFGSEAHCKIPADVKDLHHINARIGRQKERQAINHWKLKGPQKRKLNALIGKVPCDDLITSNKAVRAQLSELLTREIDKLYERGVRHFIFVTFTSAEWLTRHDKTVVPVGEIRGQIERFMADKGFNWIGMVELDICNNWPSGGNGLAVMPHAHIIAWSDRRVYPNVLAKSWSEEGAFTSLLGCPTIVVRTISKYAGLMHCCYYTTKPVNVLKSFKICEKSGNLERIYSVEHAARPYLILRLSEILSHMTIADLLIGGGEGAKTMRRILRALRSWQNCQKSQRSVAGVARIWEEIRPSRSRKCYGGVEVVR